MDQRQAPAVFIARGVDESLDPSAVKARGIGRRDRQKRARAKIDLKFLFLPAKVEARPGSISNVGCGTMRLYGLLNGGELQSYREGKSQRIIVASLRE